jgi:hypothetical protein
MTMTTLVDKSTIDSIRFWAACQDRLGFETVWSMFEFTDLDQNILTAGKSYQVCYTFYGQDVTIQELLDGTAELVEVRATAKNGSVRELWRAAEDCYQQAKAQGDWHKFIEDIKMRDDGSFKLVMGS